MWPGVVVEEVNLSVNVSALRKVLGAAPTGEWIETVPRQGYRFNAAVEVGDVATASTMHGPPGGSDPSHLGGGPSRAHLGPAALPRRRAALLIGGIWQRPQPESSAGAGWDRPAAHRTPPSPCCPSPSTAPDAYLADGIVEGVINSLTRLRDLRVTPRASAFRFKDAAGDPAAAGRALEFQCSRHGQAVTKRRRRQARVELVDVARNAQVWSTAYEVALADLPKLQGRVTARSCQTCCAFRLPAQTAPARGREPTAHAQAYQAYLQGRYLWNQRSEPSLQSAIAHFRRAIELDPRFALAHAALADAHTSLGYLGYVAPAGTFPVARPYALKALELDPSLAPAHAALAYIKFYFDWDWEGARQEFSRAIELNPNDPVSHQWYAVYLLASGQPDRGFREVQVAHRLDPLSLAINTDIGFHHYYNGRYAEAVSQLRSVLAMKSDFLLAHLWLARALLESRVNLTKRSPRQPSRRPRSRDWSVIVAARGFTYGVAGMTSEAQAVLREMDALSRQRFVTSYGVALVHAGLAQIDEAFRWLDKAFDERSHWLVWLRLDPRWKSLRSDPRFGTLVARIKYPA